MRLSNKTFGLRLPIDIEAELLRKADEAGMTGTEFARSLIVKQLEEPSLTTLIKRSNMTVLKGIFEMLVATIDLSDDQRIKAAADINKNLHAKLVK